MWNLRTQVHVVFFRLIPSNVISAIVPKVPNVFWMLQFLKSNLLWIPNCKKKLESIHTIALCCFKKFTIFKSIICSKWLFENLCYKHLWQSTFSTLLNIKSGRPGQKGLKLESDIVDRFKFSCSFFRWVLPVLF